MNKTWNRNLEVKRASSFELKSLEDDGSFTGYASVFTKDSDNDIIVKGAFKRTINAKKAKGKLVPILWQHNKSEPIGVNLEMQEDDYGLFVKGQLNLDTQRGREARSLAKQGALGGLSIGFFITERPEIKDGIRYIKEVNLFEYSFVTFPAHQDAGIVEMKGGHNVTKDKQSFNDMLTLQQAEGDLQRQRWQMEDALYQTIRNIIGDGDADDDDEVMDRDEAIKLIGQAYADYGVAMTEWYGKKIDLEAAAEADESKAASGVTAATKRMMKKALAAHDEGIRLSQKASTSHRRALDIAQQMVYSNLIRADRNAPNPVPKGNNPNPPLPPSQDEHLEAEAKALVASFSSIFK